jgi:hypothetical protein
MTERRLSFLDAAILILRETGRPMTAKELALAALERGLIKSGGKTPDATLAAQLYVRVREQPDGPLRRVAIPGPTRAQRGTVRWKWRP